MRTNRNRKGMAMEETEVEIPEASVAVKGATLVEMVVVLGGENILLVAMRGIYIYMKI